ncbi:nucleotide sugar dehydrogenase [Thermodesulfobacteriota bacterium]
MKISIFGLGYVGFITGLCLAESGHHVMGIDINALKVDMVNNGVPPIIEEQVEEKLKAVHERGSFRADTSVVEAVLSTDISLVCVGTPSLDNGNINLDYLKRVCREIGEALKAKQGYHVVMIRSTVIPGSTEEFLLPLLNKHSGRSAGKDFGVAYNPEFLREGSSIKDYYHPPKIVMGGVDDASIEKGLEIYGGLDAPVFKTSIKIAETVKYADNIFHALKITFANEMGMFAKSLGVDSHEVMGIFCQDTKLNISPAYLKPGFAFGGSCLPKDIRAFLYKSRTSDLDLPMISSLLRSNEQQIQAALQIVMKSEGRKVGVFGLSFKPGTDDLRESPMVSLVELLIGKGYEVKIHDQNVFMAKVMGANKEYIERVIPHVSRLMSDSVQEVMEHGDILVFGHNRVPYRTLRERIKPEQAIIDLAGLWADYKTLGGTLSRGNMGVNPINADLV